MSLLDMFNFSYYGFAVALSRVQRDLNEQSFALGRSFASVFRAGDIDEIEKDRLDTIKNNVYALGRECVTMRLERAESRYVRLSDMFLREFSRSELVEGLKTFLQAIEDDIQREGFFHYSRDNTRLLLAVSADWGPTFKSFPSLKSEIEEGVDC